MKKILTTLFLIVLMFTCAGQVLADNRFSDEEYSKAVTITGDNWIEFTFNQDLFFKIDVTQPNETTIIELTSDSYHGSMHYYTFTKTFTGTSTQSNVNTMPGFISLPHLDNYSSGYIKLSYNNEYNTGIINKTIKARIKTIANDISGWQTATEIGANEEHTIQFSSMNDHKWYKVQIPYQSFNYNFTIRTPETGCFISEMYSESDLINGSGTSNFSDCIGLNSGKCSINANMGSGTYYLHIYPVPLYNGVLNAKIAFSTDDSDTLKIDLPFGPTASKWAAPEIEEAYENNLIPEVMLNFDLTKKVSRGEFAAIAVQLYEVLSKQNIAESPSCSFTDIRYDDNEKAIKKAYQIEVAQGTSATTYEPLSFINREQLATMLCRVVKKYSFPDWTMEKDDDYYMDTTGVAKFEDDVDISEWAKPSVYFMSKLGIVKGVDSTHFAPKASTTQQEASGYASATREQAIIMAQRIFKLSDILGQ